MTNGTIPSNDSHVTPIDAFQRQQAHASSSGTDNNSSIVSVINNGYTAASREFERFFSSWGFNKRPNSAQATNVESASSKHNGKRKRHSNDNDDFDNSSNADNHNGPAVYARIIPDENHHVYHSSSSMHNDNNTNKPLTTFSPTRSFEPHTSDSSSNNIHQHRHTFQYLVERHHTPSTRSKGNLSVETDQQVGGENKVPANSSTKVLNDNDNEVGTPRRHISETFPNTIDTPNRRKTLEPLYVPSTADTAKYVDLNLLEEERLAKLERIIREAHSNATQLLSISQNSKSSRTVRFSPIVKHASIISSHSPRSCSNVPPPVSPSTNFSPRRSSLTRPSGYTRAGLSLPSDNTAPSTRRLAVTTTTASTSLSLPSPSPLGIKTESSGSPSSSSLSRYVRDPFLTSTNATWGPLPKHDDDDDDKDGVYCRTDRFPLKTDLASSRLTSLEPFSTSSAEMKTSSPSSSLSPLPPHCQRLSTFTQPEMDRLFEPQEQERRIVNGRKVLPMEPPPGKKLKSIDFDKEHKKSMGVIIHQIPKVKLRRTDIIRGPDGQLKPNPIWNEIYNNGRNKSRPL